MILVNFRLIVWALLLEFGFSECFGTAAARGVLVLLVVVVLVSSPETVPDCGTLLGTCAVVSLLLLVAPPAARSSSS